MSGTLEQGGRFTVPNCVPESSVLWELMFSVGDKSPESQKGCSGVDGEAGIRGCRLARSTPSHSGVKPASGEDLSPEPRAAIGLSAWTQLCSVAFVEPVKHAGDAVS